MDKSEALVNIELSQGKFTVLTKTLETHRKGLLVCKEINPIWKDNLLKDIDTVESIIKQSKRK